MNRIAAAALASCLAACAACTPGAAPPPRAAVAPPARVPFEARWDATPKAPLAWSDFTPATFTRARAVGRFVVLDGFAEWCHWCHVMEAVTYHDPAVREILDAHFVAAKVDVDARPDIEERYDAWGWPATVIFTPDGRELGKYRGFIPPERFREILEAVVAAGVPQPGVARPQAPPVSDEPLPEEEITWIARAAALDLDDYWDREQGSWGHGQKVPLYMTNEWALMRARGGDARQKKRVLFSLDQETKIIDPVWGGVDQYSTDGDWEHPHYEKLMAFNAGAIANFSEAYALTGEAKYLDVARRVVGYVDRFLSGPDGGFYTTQDADLNAHAPGKPFMTGHDYYAKGEAERLRLGVPRVDTHEYPRENGMAIVAYCKYFAASHHAAALERAKKAAGHLLATHMTPSGTLAHDADPAARVTFLSDNAQFAWGLLALAQATGDASWRAKAAAIAGVVMRTMQDDRGGGFFAQTADPDAVGVFARRRRPFEDNVVMVRVLAALARASAEEPPEMRRAIRHTLRSLATPDRVKARGRYVGDLLMALHETQGVR